MLSRRPSRTLVRGPRRRRIFTRDDFTCQVCGWRGDPDDTLTPRPRQAGHERFLTIDHIVAVADGGDNSDENVRCCCSDCNTKLASERGGRTISREEIEAYLSLRQAVA